MKHPFLRLYTFIKHESITSMFSDSKINILHRLVHTHLCLVNCISTLGSDTSERKADCMLCQVSLALSIVVSTVSLNTYTSANIMIIRLILNIYTKFC